MHIYPQFYAFNQSYKPQQLEHCEERDLNHFILRSSKWFVCSQLQIDTCYQKVKFKISQELSEDLFI